MGTGHLYVDDSAIKSGRRSARLTFEDGSEICLWYEVEGIALSARPGADPFVLGIWLLLMRRGGRFHIHGSVSRRLLSGLTEFQAAWMRWRPGRYSRVDITADHVREDSVRNPKAVVAFSGGVDASFSFRRHNTGDAGWRTVDLRAAMLVHGFDIGLAETVAFDNARVRAEKMLQGSGVELITVRTNLRELHEKWYDVFALGLASGFSLLSPGYGVGLIGSSDSYDTIDFLGGSNPVTDPLTSTGDMEVRLDGAGMSRTDKAAYLATWDLGMPLLRVCWQGRVADGNCGRCEKCVRTRLNFQIAGVPVPSCLPPVAGAQKRIWLKSPASLASWVALRRQARVAGQRDVVAVTNKVIRRSRPLVAIYGSPPLHAVAHRGRRALDRLRGDRSTAQRR
jgi:hypothetical protein